MLTRRTFLATTSTAAAAVVLPSGSYGGAPTAQPAIPAADAPAASAPMEMRAIPSSGEKLPVIGMGTSGSFEVGDADARVRSPCARC